MKRDKFIAATGTILAGLLVLVVIFVLSANRSEPVSKGFERAETTKVLDVQLPTLDD